MNHEYADLTKVLKEKDLELRNIRHSPVDASRTNKKNLDSRQHGSPCLTHRTTKVPVSNTPSVIRAAVMDGPTYGPITGQTGFNLPQEKDNKRHKLQ